MATIAVRPMQHQSPTPPPSFSDESPMTLALAASMPLPIPNKHLPTPIYTVTSHKSEGPVTPPASPPPQKVVSAFTKSRVLYPPSSFQRIVKDPPVYSIDAPTTAAAIKSAASQPLPDTDKVFPWLHGLHPDNQIQLSFFYARKKSAQKTPSCFRETIVVKVGKSLETSKLKGAILPGEILLGSSHTSGFVDMDPREGFGVRNFQIQVAKLATVSDIIVYGDGSMNKDTVKNFARRISAAQVKTRKLYEEDGGKFPEYNTFLVESPFSMFEELYPEIVAYDSRGNNLGSIPDFPQLERIEMCLMARASEISHNIWLGSTLDRGDFEVDSETPYDLLVESCDQAPFPTPSILKIISKRLKENRGSHDLEFPASGNLVDGPRKRFDSGAMVSFCAWLYETANGKKSDTDKKSAGQRVLLHCMDGYTETSVLALAYLMYAEGIQVHDAWIRLHKEKERNFFAYQCDLQFLANIEKALLQNSPALVNKSNTLLSAPRWLSKMDGSLPSRILPHMYLGNLCHANNPELLKKLGIHRILSIGEMTSWTEEERDNWDMSKIMSVVNIQDNGVDPITNRLDACLAFIDEGRRAGEATLVHCRVGVSRSATICIAEVVKHLDLSVPRAYCFVRARRLNVIIQPHLRFMYELLKWDEARNLRAGKSIDRDLEWSSIAREVALMNRPYARQ